MKHEAFLSNNEGQSFQIDLIKRLRGLNCCQMEIVFSEKRILQIRVIINVLGIRDGLKSNGEWKITNLTKKKNK